MLDYAVFLTLVVLIGGTIGKPTSSVSDEPERCCVPKQYSSQISTSTGLLLLDGKIYASYVSDMSKRHSALPRKFVYFKGIL